MICRKAWINMQTYGWITLPKSELSHDLKHPVVIMVKPIIPEIDCALPELGEEGKDFYNSPQANIPEACDFKARAVGAYGFFQNLKVIVGAGRPRNWELGTRNSLIEILLAFDIGSIFDVNIYHGLVFNF
jgi:hypothetical protein